MTEKKEFTHEEKEKCQLTNKDIDTTKHRYAVILDCDGNQITKVGFYDSNTLKDLIKGNGEQYKKEMKQQISKSMPNIGQNIVNSVQQMLGGTDVYDVGQNKDKDLKQDNQDNKGYFK